VTAATSTNYLLQHLQIRTFTFRDWVKWLELVWSAGLGLVSASLANFWHRPTCCGHLLHTPTPLETRRLRDDLIEVFKIFKGFDDVKPTDFFTMSSTGLRGHEFKLYKPQAHLDIFYRQSY